MKISALCITYGRPYLLEEAIESFIKQDYSDKELIVLNDLPEQNLVYNHPQVRVFNSTVRFPTVGEKRTASVDLSSGDLLIIWDDDDIFLPGLLSMVASKFEKEPNLQVLQPDKNWILDSGKLKMCGRCGGHYVYTRKAVYGVGLYTAMNSGQDINLLNRLIAKYKPNVKISGFTLEESGYMYRWGTGHYHLSGYGMDKNNVVSGFKKIEERIKSKGIEPQINLIPHWNQDYLKMTKDYLASIPPKV